MTTLLLLLQSYRTRLHSRQNAGTRSRMNKNSSRLDRFLFSNDPLFNSIESSLHSFLFLLGQWPHHQLHPPRNPHLRTLGLQSPHLLAGFAPLWSVHWLHAWQPTTLPRLLVGFRSCSTPGAMRPYTVAWWRRALVRRRNNRDWRYRAFRHTNRPDSPTAWSARLLRPKTSNLQSLHQNMAAEAFR